MRQLCVLANASEDPLKSNVISAIVNKLRLVKVVDLEEYLNFYENTLKDSEPFQIDIHLKKLDEGIRSKRKSKSYKEPETLKLLSKHLENFTSPEHKTKINLLLLKLSNPFLMEAWGCDCKTIESSIRGGRSALSILMINQNILLSSNEEKEFDTKDLSNCIRTLVKLGADVNHPTLLEDLNATYPLAIAAQYGLCEAMEVLVELGAKIDQQGDNEDSQGWTALQFAVANGELEAVKWLLEKGADLTIKDKEGQTAEDLAHRGQQLGQTLLTAYNPDYIHPRHPENMEPIAELLTPKSKLLSSQ
jgi:hypothetical protein